MIPTRRVIVGDGALAYREKGSGEPLLLLHSGFIADGMLPLLDQPLLQDHRMIAYHRRGYGNSDPAGGSRSISRAAEDAFGLLDVLGVEQAHLAGHSMGAVVAIEMALTQQSRVASLTLMEPLLGFALEPEAAQFVADTAQVALPLFAAGDRAGALGEGWGAPSGPGSGQCWTGLYRVRGRRP
jgi:pimeloyl-ACP methyl ester carboxylesterase